MDAVERGQGQRGIVGLRSGDSAANCCAASTARSKTSTSTSCRTGRRSSWTRPTRPSSTKSDVVRTAKIEVDDKLAELVERVQQADGRRALGRGRSAGQASARTRAARTRWCDRLMWQSRFAIRTMRNQDLEDDKEDGLAAVDIVEESAIRFDDHEPYRMPDAKTWEELTKSRQAARSRRPLASHRARAGNRAQAENARAAQVSRHARLPKCSITWPSWPRVNLHLDAKGLEEEGVSSDTPVTIDLTRGDLAQKRAEPDSRAEALELRDQGRSAQDHQRAIARRRSLSTSLTTWPTW